jgi:hypothetical protein
VPVSSRFGASGLLIKWVCYYTTQWHGSHYREAFCKMKDSTRTVSPYIGSPLHRKLQDPGPIMAKCVCFSECRPRHELIILHNCSPRWNHQLIALVAMGDSAKFPRNHIIMQVFPPLVATISTAGIPSSNWVKADFSVEGKILGLNSNRGLCVLADHCSRSRYLGLLFQPSCRCWCRRCYSHPPKMHILS